MTFQFGTVSIEATQLATDVRFVATDKFGITKSGVIPEIKINQVHWDAYADTHKRFSQAATRRN